jgi:hypothetical protein
MKQLTGHLMSCSLAFQNVKLSINVEISPWQTWKLISNHVFSVPFVYIFMWFVLFKYSQWVPYSTKINSMELSPSRGATNFGPTQEILFNLWNLKIHYRVHNSHPLVPTLNHTAIPMTCLKWTHNEDAVHPWDIAIPLLFFPNEKSRAT